jgi:outer membrane lipoprotein-sorting protein
MFAFALALAVSPGAPPADAERLLGEVDTRITAAKSLRIEFEIRRADKADEPPLKGSLVLGTHNRLRYEMSGWMTASVVSDGKQLVTVIVSPAERKSQAMPEWFGETLRAWLGRGGTYVATAKILEFADNPEVSRPGTDEGPQVSNVAFMPDEKVGDVTAKVIDYDLSWERLPTTSNTARVRVWIDPATKLPLKRTMTFPVGAKGESFTAVHTKVEIDPKVDDTLFRLPK